MQLDIYKSVFDTYFSGKEIQDLLNSTKERVLKARQIFFVGNGGSNSICSHMMEDYAKIGGYRTFAFSDPAIITCFSNDFGYENAMKEWLKIYMDPGDLLFALSSSGKSKNILNAAAFAKERNATVISLTGFDDANPLRQLGAVNFYIPSNSYGIVECYHQVILHVLLDSLHEN